MKYTVVSPAASLLAIMGMLVGMLMIGQQRVEAAPPQTSGLTTPITGSFADALGGTGEFEGTFTIDRFVTSGGTLAAVGTLEGTLTDSLGNILGTVSDTVTLPVSASGTCEILYLELGPLDLDLLGLQVHLDQVVLDITAESGPGNLLGNLLCGVAGLLDSGVTTNSLVRLLNQLLGLF